VPPPDPAPESRPEPPSDSLVEMLRGLQAGETLAQSRLLSDYLGQLTRLAADRIGKSFQNLLSPDAIAVAALHSFIVRVKNADWEMLDQHALWLLLARITQRKCAREMRDLLAAKRDIRRQTGQRDDAVPVDPPSGDPGPEEVACFQDLLRWVRNEGDAVDQEIVSLRLDGKDVRDISVAVNRSERNVQYRLVQLRKRLEARLGEA
jgi:RNA polymerase sigma-70 factor, ECF subfamily